MSFIDRRKRNRPPSGAAPFELREVTYSRTDAHGVILAASDGLRQLTDQPWNALVGAPHNITRHPDMPRGLFHLFWQELDAGRPVAVFLKDRARDGLHFWSLLAAMPFESGHVAARIRPSTPLFDEVAALYGRISAREQAEALAPEESARSLLEGLATLGFESLADFSARALSAELAARAEALEEALPPRIERLCRVLELTAALRDDTAELIGRFNAMRTIPHNMRVTASRLEPTGGPISVLSQNYATISSEMSAWFADHVRGDASNFATIAPAARRAVMVEGLAMLLAECRADMQGERRALGPVDKEAERALLDRLAQSTRAASSRALSGVATEAGHIRGACETMARHLLSLSTTRVLCKIESARLPENGDALTDIIAQLKHFQERINDQLKRISAHADAVISAARP